MTRLKIQHLSGLFIITLSGLGLALVGTVGQRTIYGPKAEPKTADADDEGSPSRSPKHADDLQHSSNQLLELQVEGTTTCDMVPANAQPYAGQVDLATVNAIAAVVVAELSAKGLLEKESEAKEAATWTRHAFDGCARTRSIRE